MSPIDFTAGMEDELDVVSDGREDYKLLARPVLERLQAPRPDEVMEKLPSEVTEALDEYLSDFLFPPREDGAEPARLSALRQARGREGGRPVPARRQVRAPLSPAANYSRMQVHPPLCPAGRRGGDDGADDGVMGPASRNRRGYPPQDGALWPLRPDGRGQGSQAGQHPQGSRRFSISIGR